MTESIRHLITLHAQCEWGQVIGVGVHLYINVYMGMFVDKTTTLNRTLAIDSPLQTFTVGLLIEFHLPLLSPETLSSSSKSKIFLYNAHLALFVRMDDTITCTSTLISIVI